MALTLKGSTGPTGTLGAVLIKRNFSAPLSWQLRNKLRIAYIWGKLANSAAKGFSRLTGIPTITSELMATLIKKDGTRIHYGVVDRRVITTAGVNFLVDDWDDDSTDITTMTYHGCGTGTTAAAVGDTALETELTGDLNPNNTRATGGKTQPSANILQSAGTLTFDPAATTPVTEHGVLDQAATGGGSLWDRHVFAAINVESGDSIAFTYQCTIAAGG